ncbi:hypothetical protein D3C84_1208760 [compost metagenome]
MIFLAISGNPSFLTKGKTATFVGAKTDGNFKTVLVEPSSKTSSCNDVAKTAKNIRSNPTEVSTT